MKRISKKAANRLSKYKRKDKSKKAAAWKTPPKEFRQHYNRRFRGQVRMVMFDIFDDESIVLPVFKKTVKWEWW